MKILCVLYDGPKEGMPNKYALDSIPKLETHPEDMTLPTAEALVYGILQLQKKIRRQAKEKLA